MAKSHHPSLRPALNKTPFGGVPAKGKLGGNTLLPSRHALDQLVKDGPSQPTISSYGRLTPIGSGAPNPYEKLIKEGDF